MATASVVTVAALAGVAWSLSPATAPAADQARSHPAEQHQAEALEPETMPSVTIRTAELVVPETTPGLRPLTVQATPPPARAQRVTPPARQVTTASAGKPDALPSRLARFITGDGRHEVRPFPTVPPERR
ncbi:hypothetical protein BH23ACI1_BH23ACI1_29530 [soil metagenome]